MAASAAEQERSRCSAAMGDRSGGHHDHAGRSAVFADHGHLGANREIDERPSPQGDYVISTFAADKMSGCASDFAASPTCYFNVDSLTNDDSFAYAGYQNAAAADGSSGSSILVKYARSGGPAVLFSPTLPGKTDGLRFNPFTHQLWALNNEDSNPVLRIIDPGTMSVVQDTPLPTNQHSVCWWLRRRGLHP